MSNGIVKALGYTKEIQGESDGGELFLLVKPNTDLDTRFKAWCTDEQEYIYVQGYCFTFTEGHA